MEFLNKFKHDSDRKQEALEPTITTQPVVIASPTPPAAEPVEPERDLLTKLIAGSGHTHGQTSHRPPSSSSNAAAASTTTDSTHHHHTSLFTTKQDREAKALELVKREAELRYKLELLAKEKTDNEGFFATLRARFDREAEHDKTEAHAAGTPGEFWDKFTGRDEMERKRAELERREAELKGELAVVEREKRENEGLVERLKGHFDGGDGKDEDEGEEGKGKGKGEEKKEEEKEGRKEHQSEIGGLLDKLTGKAAEEERLRREEESKSSLEKIKDRVNESMGGGEKAEEREDLLDKAIDEFQEHVLHKGDQDNESALEQIKDDKVADIIRSRLHLREKKDEE